MKTAPCKTAPWTTYRTRFLVQAKALTSNLSFTDALGRRHTGRKGDYLVESADGVLCIHPKQIFEDIYVPIAESYAGLNPVRQNRDRPYKDNQNKIADLVPAKFTVRGTKKFSAIATLSAR